MNITSAIFDRSAPDLASCPDETLPEFAFIGRSNVGNSSLLNMLSGKPDLALFSKTHGFTKMINVFTMNKTWRLVDLPGYGYAHVAREHKAQFNHAVNNYLQHRANLSCVFALIDSSLPPQKIDLEFVKWLARHSVPFVLVFTKTDTGTPASVRTNMDAFKDSISGWFEKLPASFTCSATAKHGRRELLAVIDEAIAAGQGEPQVESEASAPDPASSPGDLPAVGRKVSSRDTRTKRPNPARPW